MKHRKYYVFYEYIPYRDSHFMSYSAVASTVGRFIGYALMFGGGFVIGQVIRGFLQAFGIM